MSKLYTALGLMSGTSLDGIEIALIRTDGEGLVSLGLGAEAVIAAEAAGFNDDSMEAEAWAYLAVRSLKGLPITFPGTTGAPEPMTGGVLAEE